MKKNKFFFFLFILVLSWAILATYLSARNINIIEIAKKYAGDIETPSYKNTEKELEYVSYFLKEYYNINRNDISNQYSKIEELVESKAFYDISERYLSSLESYKKNRATQKIEIERIEKVGSIYKCLVILDQKFKDKNQRLFVLVNISLSNNLLDEKKSFKIKKFQEKIMMPSKVNLSNSQMKISKDSFVSVSLPCSINGVVSSDKNKDIDFNFKSSKRKIIFKSNSKFSETASFGLNCKNTKFNILLIPESGVVTLFENLRFQDGKRLKRKLTPRERLKKDLEEQFNVQIISNAQN
jgi:hypothetical protein